MHQIKRIEGISLLYELQVIVSPDGVVLSFTERTFIQRLGLMLLGDLNIIWEMADQGDDDFWRISRRMEIIRWRMLDHGMEVERAETAITLIHLFILWTTEDVHHGVMTFYGTKEWTSPRSEWTTISLQSFGSFPVERIEQERDSKNLTMCDGILLEEVQAN
ncbi:hypothetical protein Tco_0067251 [Tanacetum coccineum]